MHYTTAFRDIAIDSVPTTFSGLATWHYDPVYEDYFVTRIELHNVLGGVTLTRCNNKDERLNLVFSQIEDVLLDHAVTNYDSPTKHYFYEGLGGQG